MSVFTGGVVMSIKSNYLDIIKKLKLNMYFSTKKGLNRTLVDSLLKERRKTQKDDLQGNWKGESRYGCINKIVETQGIASLRVSLKGGAIADFGPQIETQCVASLQGIASVRYFTVM